MATRRRLLALTAGSLSGIAGCLDGGAGDGIDRGTPTQTDVAGVESDEPAETETTEADRTTVDSELSDWDPAWTLETDFPHVLGVDAGPDRLYLTLNSDDGRSAVAAVRRGEDVVDWIQPFEGEAEGANPRSPDDHRDQWGVAVADGAVYSVHGRAESYEWTAVHALDAESGDRLWTFERKRDLYIRGVRGGTVVATGLEFFEPEHSHDTPEEPLRTVVYGVDAASGTEQWSVSFDGVEDVAVGAETVVVATADGVTAVGLDGIERWQDQRGEPIRALSTVGDVTVIVTGEDRRDATVVGLGPEGSERWSRSLSVESLFAHGGRVYGFGRNVAALKPDGTVAWTRSTYGDEPTFSPSGDRLYARAGRRADGVDAVALPRGRHEFRFDAPSDDAWPVAATADAVVVEAITPDEADFTSLFAVDARTGEPRAVYRPDDSVFDTEAVDGTVYTGFGDGSLAAFETGEW